MGYEFSQLIDREFTVTDTGDLAESMKGLIEEIVEGKEQVTVKDSGYVDSYGDYIVKLDVGDDLLFVEFDILDDSKFRVNDIDVWELIK